MLVKKDELKEDILRQYIDAEDIVKAPEGFSSQVMSRIYMEAKPVRSENKMVVPVVSSMVFIMLTAVTLLVTERTLNLPDINWPDNFNFSFPELGSSLKLPHITLYAIAGIALIILIDSVFIAAIRRKK